MRRNALCGHASVVQCGAIYCTSTCSEVRPGVDSFASVARCVRLAGLAKRRDNPMSLSRGRYVVPLQIGLIIVNAKQVEKMTAE